MLSSALVAGAQTSIEEVLRSVETNNKELQANRQMVTAQKLEAKLDKNLPDPTVTYSHLYGNNICNGTSSPSRRAKTTTDRAKKCASRFCCKPKKLAWT